MPGKRSVANVKNFFSSGIVLFCLVLLFCSLPHTNLGSHLAFDCHPSLVSFNLKQWLSTRCGGGRGCPLEDLWKCLETFFDCSS